MAVRAKKTAKVSAKAKAPAKAEAPVERTYTREEMRAEFRKWQAEERAAKKEARQAFSEPGVLHAIPVTEKDALSNVLAKCVYVCELATGGHAKVEGTAVQVMHGSELKIRYVIGADPAWSISGESDTDVQRLLAKIDAKQEVSAEIAEYLIETATEAAKDHVFTPKAK